MALSPGEIKKLKDNEYDPHDLKPGGSKDDLFKCKPSGKIVVKRKTKYFDPNKGDKGGWVHPDETEPVDTGININDLPWKGMASPMQEEVIIQFRVTGFVADPTEVLRDLGVTSVAKKWRVGQPRVPNSLLRHSENGFYLVADRRITDFGERVNKLLDKVYPLRSRLARLKAGCELSCVFYLSGSQRPIIHFPKGALSRLAELGASVDVDVYYLSDKEENRAETPYSSEA